MKIRRNDIVEVMTGDDKGERGRVLKVMPKEGRLIVEHVNYVYRHMRPTAQRRESERIQKEAPINVSNVRLVCPKCEKAVRIRQERVKRERPGGGMKDEVVRICKKCGEAITQGASA